MVWTIFSMFVLLFTYLAGNNSYSQKQKVIYRICLVLVLSVMTGFGAVVGTDHEAYVYMYSSYTEFNANQALLSFFTDYSIEPGFQILNVVGNFLHIPEPMFFFMLACLMNTLFVSVIFRYPYPLLAVITFIVSEIFFQEVNILRQALAVSIILYSTKYLDSHKPWSFVVGTAIATSMHASALIFIFLVFLPLINYEKRSNLIFYICLFLWLLSILSIIGFKSIQILNPIASLLLETRYANKFQTNDNLGYGAYQVNLFLNVLMLLILFSMRKRVRKEMLLIALGCIIQNFGAQLAPLLRISLYFTAMMPLAMGCVVDTSNYKKGSDSIISGARFLIVAYFIFTLTFKYILGSPILGSKFYYIYNM